jgi:hypothetical protein
MATSEFSQDDKSLFVSFPYANTDRDLRWSLELVMENAESQSYSKSLGESGSGILTVEFPNMIGYSLNIGEMHGAAIGPYPAGVLSVRLLLEDKVVQEIKCQVVER